MQLYIHHAKKLSTSNQIKFEETYHNSLDV